MKLAVTGSRGQLVRSLGELVQAHGMSLTTIARPALDLGNSANIVRAVAELDCDVVVNAAAYTAVDRAEVEPEAAFAINADAAGTIAEACARRGIPIIQISTDYVFDGTKDGPYTETDPTQPMNVYGRSKCLGEERVAQACERHIILRTAWLHSAFGHNFVKTMLRLAGDRSEISVVADQYGSPTSALHLAEAIIAIAKRARSEPDAMDWGVYHYADVGRASWCDVAEATFSVSQGLGGPTARVRPIPTSEYRTAARRPSNSCLATGKIAAALGIALRPWQAGIKSSVSRALAEHEVA